MTTKVHITNDAWNRPFECISIGDYFHYEGDIYIRTDNEFDIYGYAVRLKDGRKIPFDNHIEVSVIEKIKISIG